MPSNQVTITTTPQIDVSGTEAVNFIAAVNKINLVVPLKNYIWKQIGTSPKKMQFTINAVDNRKWDQIITFDILTNPKLDFHFPGDFRPSEVIIGGLAFGLAFGLIVKYNLTSIDVEFP